MCGQSLMKKLMKFEIIESPTVALPQISKAIPQMRKLVRGTDKTIDVAKELKLGKSELPSRTQDLLVLPMSPKLKPRKLRLDFEDLDDKRNSRDLENSKETESKKEIAEVPFRRSIRVRKLVNRVERKRLFSQENQRNLLLNPQKDDAIDLIDKKLMIKVANKETKDKILSWNIAHFRPKSPTFEPKNIDIKRVSKLARLINQNLE